MRFRGADSTRATSNGALDKAPSHRLKDSKPSMTRAFLFLTRIEGLDLSDAKGLQQPQIDTACGDVTTKLPPGLSIPTTWPCGFD